MEIKGCVSVVIPVYNVENYLKECLDSVIEQTYKNIEIIIVDDGSTDKSGEICDFFADGDQRIRVLHKQNGGLSDARNAGMDIMNGEFFTFVDSDDTIQKDAIKRMVDQLRSSGADMAAFGYRADICATEEIKEAFVISSEELMRRILQGKDNYVQVAVWARLYYTKYAGDIRFSSGYVGCEDIEFTTEVLSKIERCVCSREVVYNYRIIKGSLSHNNRIYFPEIICSKWHQIEIVKSREWVDIAASLKASFYRELLYYLSKEKSDEKRSILKRYLKKSRLEYTEFQMLKRRDKLKAYIESAMPAVIVCLYYLKYRKDCLELQWK